MFHVAPTACSTTMGALALIGITFLFPTEGVHEGPYLPPGCEKLAVPAGNVLSFHAFASGVQIYQWNVTTGKWDLLGPAATLYADAGLRGVVGTHYVGPTWESNSGSAVVGSLVEGAVVDPTAVRWLKLSAVTSSGPGPFDGTTFIQRVNTTGGLAPAVAGAPGQIVEAPYTAEYFFYRAG